MTAPIPFEQYDRIGQNLRAEIDKLREVSAFKSVELHARDRVIARLLDGWGLTDDLDELLWIGGPNGDDVYEAMSDGEAAIIRQHQERTR